MIHATLPTGAETLTISTVAGTPLAFIQTAASAPDWKPRKGTNSFRIYVRSGSINCSGSFTPTTTTGQKVASGNTIEYINVSLDAVQIIRDGGSDATIHIFPFQDNLKR